MTFLNLRAKVHELVDQAHIWTDPLTPFFYCAVHGMKVWLVSFVKTICKYQRGRPADTELAMDQHILSGSYAAIDYPAEREKIVDKL